jgi:hypothetical protein
MIIPSSISHYLYGVRAAWTFGEFEWKDENYGNDPQAAGFHTARRVRCDVEPQILNAL